MKWADFGLSKKSRDGQFSQSCTGGRTGTTGWIAPEILENDDDAHGDDGNHPHNVSNKCGIWSAGCVFFYYLTKGKHPFGDDHIEIPLYARNGNPIKMKRIVLYIL